MTNNTEFLLKECANQVKYITNKVNTASTFGIGEFKANTNVDYIYATNNFGITNHLLDFSINYTFTADSLLTLKQLKAYLKKYNIFTYPTNLDITASSDKICMVETGRMIKRKRNEK